MIRLLAKLGFGRAGRTDAHDGLPVVAVSGALRSGTNFLKFLLERDYHAVADFNAFGWKHAGVPVLSSRSGIAYRQIPLLYVVKNPYAFVVSLHRYHQRNIIEGQRISITANAEFNSFVTGPIVLSDSQLSGSPQLRFANPVQYWNFINWNLETLDRSRFQAIGFKYEDLINDPEGLRRIEDVAALRRRSPTSCVFPRNRLGRLAGVHTSTARESEEPFDPAYYTEERYLLSYTPEQLAFIGAEVDPTLMEKLGYRIL